MQPGSAHPRSALQPQKPLVVGKDGCTEVSPYQGRSVESVPIRMIRVHPSTEGPALRPRLSWLVAALLLGISAAAAAQPAAYRRYRTLDTPHFHVHVAPGLEREGRVAAAAGGGGPSPPGKEARAPPRGVRPRLLLH